MTTYTWAFPHLEVAPSENGLSNVVKTVHWRMIATQDGYSAEAYGSVSLSSPDPDAFTAFDGLTKATVQGWVESTLSVQDTDAITKMQDALVAQIDRQKSPPIVTMSAPWS
jgi:hypothetical protein